MSALPRPKLAALALTLACAWPTIGHAEFAPVATFQGGLTGLQFEVIDLDPDDGITAGFSVQGSGVDIVSETIFWEGSVLPTTAIAQTVAPGRTVFASPDSLTVQAEISLADLLSNEGMSEAGATLSAGVFLFPAVVGFDGEGGMGGPANLILAPNTRLILRGNVSMSMTLDNAALNDWLPTSGFDQYELNAEGGDGWNNIASLAFMQGNAQAELIDGGPLDGDGGVLTQLSTNGITTSAQRAFGISLDNTDDTELASPFLLGVSAVKSVRLYASGTPAIPEPGTWALMGLGLAAIGAASRRRDIV